MGNIYEENWNFHRLCASILGKFPKIVFTASVVFYKNYIADDCANFGAIFYFCWYDEEIKSKTSLPKLVTTTMNLSGSFTFSKSHKVIKVLFIYCTEPMRNPLLSFVACLPVRTKFIHLEPLLQNCF